MKKVLLLFVFFLTACASQSPAPVSVNGRDYMGPPASVLNDKSYYRISEPIQCVPHARKVSGIEIYGDAHTWWRKAVGRFERGALPREGAVLVLSKTQRLKYGHLAVVKRIIDSRTIEVAHSNWGGDRTTRCVIYNNMPVKDVSPANDWSQLRFWNYPSESFGSIYPASGCIYPNKASGSPKPVSVSVPRPQTKPSYNDY